MLVNLNSVAENQQLYYSDTGVELSGCYNSLQQQ